MTILGKDAKDITGLRVGRWTVICPSERRVKPSGKASIYWLCKCDCGTEKSVFGGHLRRGATQSCGCLPKHTSALVNLKHGQSKTSIYNTWLAIVRRTTLTSDAAYPNYGGRGVTVCSRWRDSFESFRDDMGPRPSPQHTVDRIDNGKGYEPGNCRWATRTEQNRNRRDNVKIEFMGKRLCIAEWEEKLGVPPNTIGRRIRDLGWPVERAMTQPVRKIRSNVKEAGATQ